MPNERPSDTRGLQPQKHYTLIDNLTLFHSRRFFDETASGSSSSRFTDESINELACDATKSAFLGFLESVVLHETCAIDHFTLSASRACGEVQRLFPDCVRPVFLDPEVRDSIYSTLRNRRLGLEIEKVLTEEQDTVHRTYYQDLGRLNAGGAASTFTDNYYVSDDYKERAIQSGEYDALNVVRSHFYVLLAAQTQMPYSPHPLRVKLIDGASRPEGIANAIVAGITKEVSEALRRELAGLVRYMTESRAPLIARKILLRAGEPRNVRDVALEMRDTKSARAFRKWCREFGVALESGAYDAKEVQRHSELLKSTLSAWAADLDEGVKYKTRRIKFSLGFGNIKGDLDGFSVKDRVLTVEKRLRPLLFLNDIFRP